MSPSVNEEQFRQALQAKLGVSWERALTVFRNFGRHVGWDVINVLLHAADKGKVEEVLEILEEHYENHLQYQHPDIRGTVRGDFGVNKTERMFIRICSETLGLQPTTT